MRQKAAPATFEPVGEVRPSAAMSRPVLLRLANPLLRDRLLQALLVLALALAWHDPPHGVEWLGWVDWPTIATLGGLLLLTKGIELSGALARAGQRIVERLQTQRRLALFLVASTALLSMLLTNDVALFIAVPLTVGLRRRTDLPVGRLVIFEALAVNAGSLATPIGNPQNILLWHRSGLSFAAFTQQMAPLAAVLLTLLLIATAVAFAGRRIEADPTAAPAAPDWRLFLGSAAAYLGFLAALAWGQPGWGAAAVLLLALLAARAVLLEVDWGLLVVFVLMFVDVHLATSLPGIRPLADAVAGYSQSELFFAALAWSQVVSNVPATILLLGHVSASKLVAYAVNVAGFGVAIGSLANLIALRLANEPGLGRRFHLYSLPALLLGALVAWWLL